MHKIYKCSDLNKSDGENFVIALHLIDDFEKRVVDFEKSLGGQITHTPRNLKKVNMYINDTLVYKYYHVYLGWIYCNENFKKVSIVTGKVKKYKYAEQYLFSE